VSVEDLQDEFDDEPERDDWFDDDPVWVKEEPDCYVCNDFGGRCCEPTRLDILRWRIRSCVQEWTQGLRRRRSGASDEPPF
jgi:hypothetical protein